MPLAVLKKSSKKKKAGDELAATQRKGVELQVFTLLALQVQKVQILTQKALPACLNRLTLLAFLVQKYVRILTQKALPACVTA